MSSIIDHLNANNINYVVTSSTPSNINRGPEKAFSKEDENFQTQENPSYWQIYFSEEVTIGSYIISGGSVNGNSITSWDMSYSLDDSSFIYLQTDKISDLRGNTKRFPLKKLIKCKYLKITGRTTTNNSNSLYFNGFDCFWDGALKRVRVSCNVALIKNRIIANELIALMIFCISK